MEAAQVNRLDESSKENSLFFYMIMLNGSSMEQ